MDVQNVRGRTWLISVLMAASFPVHGEDIGSESDAERRRQEDRLREVEVRSGRDPASDELSGEEIARYRGTGNGDVFSQFSGVQLNNIRNEAGALDIGIRGLQGEGRVPIIIDGALQSTHTFRGYQGESDRTYIDMDLIRNISVVKGASTDKYGTGALGGVVQMRTIAAEDVVVPGQTWGVWLKSSLYNNNQTPTIPDKEIDQQYYVLRNGIAQGRINNGALAGALAYKTDALDWLIAYSRRQAGNYFSGRNGALRYASDVVVKPGQEVVNTSYASDSSLAKLGWNPGAAQRLEFIYRHHEQTAGEVMAAYWQQNNTDKNLKPLPAGVNSMPQWSLGSARLNSYSGAYTYAPADNKLIDLRVGLWKTSVDLAQHNGLFGGPAGASFGNQYRHKYADDRHGMNISNRSGLAALPLSVDYGLSMEEQRTSPRNPTQRKNQQPPSSRDARRSEYGVFLNGELDTALVSVKIGTKMHGATVNDYLEKNRIRYQPHVDLLSELQLHLGKNLDLYMKGGRAYRDPSLFESTSSAQTFSYDKSNPLKSEQSQSWELGLQAKLSNVLLQNEKMGARFGYFANTVNNFISSGELEQPGLPSWDTTLSFLNYDRMELNGWEAKVFYDNPHFFADASAILYDQPRICSQREAQRLGGPECNAVGYDWSLISTRIPPRRSFNISAGVRLLEGAMTLGGRLKYHSEKKNPIDWLQGTGARAVVAIPSEKIIDLFATYRLNQHINVDFNIDNLTNRYAFDPGTVIGMPMPGRTVRLALEARF